jgi:DNA phosphorothioation-associated putative methyltransferase
MAGKMNEVDAACRQSKIGKQTPTALYVHRSALEELHPLIRVYEGCARVLVGEVEGANILKLRRDEPRVTYLSYPQFDKDPHPALVSSVHVNLRTLDVEHRSYEDSDNPPILHRKEEFVTADYPLRGKFERLTKQEERRGLYEDTEAIGTRRSWLGVLLSRGLVLHGHSVVRHRT